MALLMEEGSVKYNVVPLAEAKTDHQVIAAVPAVVQCQVCQSVTEIFVEKLIPSTVEDKHFNEEAPVIRAQFQQEYIRCLCDSLLLAEKRSTGIYCPKPDCKYIIRESQPCCINCPNLFRFFLYSPDQSNHCSHCSIFSKFVHETAEISFCITIIFLVNLFVAKFVSSNDFSLDTSKSIVMLGIAASSIIIAYASDVLVFLERLFTTTDFQKKLSDYIHNRCPSNSTSFSPLVRIPEAEIKHQVIPVAHVTAKCQVCQVNIDVSIEKLLSSTVQYNCCLGCCDRNTPGKESEVRSCKCLLLAKKRSKTIYCPKLSCEENFRDRRACCINCPSPFRFYSLGKTSHCSHCTIFSKLVHGIAEISFIVGIISLLVLSAKVFVVFVYDPSEILPYATKIISFLIFVTNIAIAAIARYIIGEMERPFTLKNLKKKLLLYIG